MVHDANNLTKIKGLNRWIEEKLNHLELYTFLQISNLTEVDVETITEILEIAPHRIDDEKWILQAKDLVKN
ncbi:MAG: hypothetical protein CVU09_14465 [Bacteroidetes bacterium HGW-Bacteroidetes-4]|jgi:predicted flap endonuclease-1-like 5' DNA nuclease|nr:MAG: hypothetical protein CVU09_14465 [Bacteroidetes bacterium HGW-Bacteroidetes-4]